MVVRKLARLLAAGVALVAIWIVWRVPWLQPAMGPAPTATPSAATPELPLSSKAAVLIDAQTGRLLYAKAADQELQPASVTKIMTLMLALEAIQQGKARMTDEVVASERAASMGGSQIWLEPGERMSLRDLLYAVAVGSANDASVAVAEHLAGSEGAFVDWMNRRARELGMKHTHFANATGLPPEETGTPGPHVSSALDLALLARQAIQTPQFLQMVSTWEYTMRPQGIRKPVLYNFNRMLKRYPGVDGIKTGMTSQAGYCVAITALRDNLRLITVTMAAPTASDREKDVRTLLDWGFRRYEARQLAREGQVVGHVEVVRGEPSEVPLVLGQNAFLTVERGASIDVRPELTLPRGSLMAPLPERAGAGELRLFDRTTGELVARVPIQVARPVAVAPVTRLVGRNLVKAMQSLVPVGRRMAPEAAK